MSKPLIENPKRKNEASEFHRRVFAAWGNACALCSRKAPATDAAHVLNRAMQLGPLRYASVHFARPAHRDCHERVGRYEIEWPLDIRQDAVRAFNEIAKTKLVVPDA